MKKYFDDGFSILVLLLFYLIVGDSNIFLFLLGYSLFRLYSSFFYNINFKRNDGKRVVNAVSGYVIFMNIIFLIISFGLGFIMEGMFCLNYVILIFVVMSLGLSSYVMVRIYSNYLKQMGVWSLYRIVMGVVLLAVSAIMYLVYDYSSSIRVLLVVSSLVLVSNVYALLVYWKFFRGSEGVRKRGIEKRFKTLLRESYEGSLEEVFASSYFYLGIVYVFYLGITRYGYSYFELGVNMSKYYFFLMILIYHLVGIVRTGLKGEMLEIWGRKNLGIMVGLEVLFLGLVVKGMRINYALELVVYYLFLLFYYISVDELKKDGKSNLVVIVLSCGLFMKLGLGLYLVSSYVEMGYNIVVGDIVNSVILFIVVGFNCMYFLVKEGGRREKIRKLISIKDI